MDENRHTPHKMAVYNFNSRISNQIQLWCHSVWKYIIFIFKKMSDCLNENLNKNYEQYNCFTLLFKLIFKYCLLFSISTIEKPISGFINEHVFLSVYVRRSGFAFVFQKFLTKFFSFEKRWRQGKTEYLLSLSSLNFRISYYYYNHYLFH